MKKVIMSVFALIMAAALLTGCALSPVAGKASYKLAVRDDGADTSVEIPGGFYQVVDKRVPGTTTAKPAGIYKNESFYSLTTKDLKGWESFEGNELYINKTDFENGFTDDYLRVVTLPLYNFFKENILSLEFTAQTEDQYADDSITNFKLVNENKGEAVYTVSHDGTVIKNGKEKASAKLSAEAVEYVFASRMAYTFANDEFFIYSVSPLEYDNTDTAVNTDASSFRAVAVITDDGQKLLDRGQTVEFLKLLSDEPVEDEIKLSGVFCYADRYFNSTPENGKKVLNFNFGTYNTETKAFTPGDGYELYENGNVVKKITTCNQGVIYTLPEYSFDAIENMNSYAVSKTAFDVDAIQSLLSGFEYNAQMNGN